MIEYRVNETITPQQFLELLNASSLAERRPIDDFTCIHGMVSNADLTVTAWDSDDLVGVARSVTDFHYCCYLSDLAVAKTHQDRGIGRRLQALTQEQLGPKCLLILLAAPAAHSYYEHIGLTPHPRCWILERDARIRE